MSKPFIFAVNVTSPKRLAAVFLIFCFMPYCNVTLGQEFDLLPDIQPAAFEVHATVLTNSLPVEQEQVTEVFTQRVGPIDLVSIPGPGDDILVATYGGFVYRMNPTTGNLQETPFLDVGTASSPTYNPNFEIGGAHGFSSIAFHPDYADPSTAGFGKFYTLEAEQLNSGTPDFVDSTQPGLHHDDVLYEYTMASLSDTHCNEECHSSKREVLRILQPGWHHNLGDLAFDTDGLLYVSSADGSTSRRTAPFMSDNSQTPSTIFGNILRIDPLGSNSQNGEYGIPASNPFVNDDSFLNEIWAWGFRNPFRISFDSETGDLYTTDTGELRIESAYRCLLYTSDAADE